MRNAFIDEMERLAACDERIAVVTADLGYSVMESFAKRYPSRFFNVGISEQIMTSAAAGIALSGHIVFTYSIGNFATLRCIEQIRNDVCYHHANVKIVAVGGGFAYGQLGMSHHATEDISMMRSLPNMCVLTPADPQEARAAVQFAVERDGPCYIRLARSGEKVLYEKPEAFDICRIHSLREGKDVALLLCGPLLKEGIKAAELLEKEGVSSGVYDVSCVKPLDCERVRRLAAKYPLLITAEEQVISGGLGGAIAEVLCDIPRHARLRRLGLNDEYTAVVGSHEYLCEIYGLSAEKICATVLKEIGKTK